ncbi:MAG: glycine/sarcosine/betaine reductase component B subunit [Thermodesulfobacteriota bacterium]|nr:glycine/sarcosine/betaine reductase component B subunit [Thermodesulfobacteriota bacterium]
MNQINGSRARPALTHQLELYNYHVRELRLGEETSWSDGVLTVNAEALKKYLIAEAGVRRVGIAVTNPGDSVRIVNILDAIEPRTKPGDGQIFPGFLGAMDGTVGHGVTHALDGSAVLVCGSVPGEVANQVVSEAIVDMTGPGARYTPFSQTRNLVLWCDFYDDQSPLKRVSVARYAGLMAARWLAEATLEHAPDEIRTYGLLDKSVTIQNGTPQVVYICPGMLLSDLHQTFLAGSSLTSTPTVVHPTQLMDGILVSGNYDIGSTRNPTYLYQRSPIVETLFAYQDKGLLSFMGVIVTKCLIEGSVGKQRSAYLAAQTAKLLDADGVVISIEECGHAYADLMLTCQACEEMGINTVLLMAESAGATGAKPGPIAFAESADAVVSVGNMDEVISLPPVDFIYGGPWSCGRWMMDNMALESIETPLANIFAATCQMGSGRLKGEMR